ncbi:MAG: DUF7453 family protein [Candidatus Eiseniibacteriota bacterium]
MRNGNRSSRHVAGLVAAALIAAALIGPVPVSRAAAPFTTVVLTGDPVPGTPPGTNFSGLGGFQALVELNDAGLTVISAQLEGPAVTVGLNDHAILAGTTSGLSGVVARAGDPTLGAEGVPGGPWKYECAPNRPLVNESGTVAAHWSMSDNIGLRRFGIFTGSPFGLARLCGEPAPGIPSALLNIQNPITLGNSGAVAFFGTLTGAGITLFNDHGLWAGLPGAIALVARQGDQAPGLPAGVVISTSLATPFLSYARINGAGQVAFIGFVSGPGVVPGVNDQCVWFGAPGSVALVARSGSPAPGVGGGVVFQGFVSEPKINDAGDVVFGGVLTGPGITSANDEGIWFGTPGSLSLVARDGDPAPGVPGEVFTSLIQLQHTLLNGAGEIAFGGETDVTGRGIWVGPPGSFDLVLLQGMPAPGLPGFEFQGDAPAFVLSPSGQVAFATTATQGDTLFTQGLWASDGSGALVSVCLAGETIEVRPGDFRTVLFPPSFPVASAGEDGMAHSFNASGSLAGVVAFDNNLTGGVLVFHLGPGVVGAPHAANRADPPAVLAAPNPFLGSTRIRFESGGAPDERISIYDVAGRRIRTLRPRAGAGEATWDGMDRSGRRAPAGVYWVRLEGGTLAGSGRIVLLR